jgi:hypothetical protein
MEKYIYEILVPTVRRVDGKPYRTRYHRVWDKKVEAISGGLTITPPGKGYWFHEGQSVRERMIPVRVMCTREEIMRIVDLTLEYYDQLVVMAYRVGDEIILKHQTAGKGGKNV